MDDGVMKEKGKTLVRHPDRVTLLPEQLQKLDAWIEQVVSKHKGVQLTRNNILHWLIASRPAILSCTEEVGVAKAFYDEERFLKQAMQELRERKRRGERASIFDLLRAEKSDATAERRSKVRRSKCKIGDEHGA